MSEPVGEPVSEPEATAAPTPLFTEAQDPSWPFVALALGAVTLATASALTPMGRVARAGVAAVAAGGVGLLAWEFILPMHTAVVPEEVQIRFGRRTRFRIPLKHVVRAYYREYSPLAEFGGWGIRFGTEGRAFNLRGNRGVQLELKSGRKVLIGSQRAEELAEAIRRACGCEGAEAEPEIVEETIPESEPAAVTIDVDGEADAEVITQDADGDDATEIT